MNSIIFWLKAARVYTMPMTIMSWLVVFVWGLSDDGNILLGILTLIGILLAHLGTNLFDDYLDYKKGVENIQNLKEKCWYLKSGEATLAQTLFVVCIYFGLAALIGLFLTWKIGIGVAVIAFLAGILCLFYSPCTYIGLGEVLVGLLFSPFLYLGTYYVMTHGFSKELMLIAISTGLLVVAVLYTHMIIDFDSDKADNKITLCRIFRTKENSLYILTAMLILAYVNIGVLIWLKILSLEFLLVFLSLPNAYELVRLMVIHVFEPADTITEKTFWMGPIDSWEDIKDVPQTRNFKMRICTSINLMAAFSLLICLAKVL
jgi:1,4-dihydroxy-2-naphthoate octaprenyltransferase